MNVYFLGIAGAGVSALASVLASEGCGVSGSDDGVFPPVSTYLDRLGIPYHVGFDAGLVPDDIDAAVIGSSAKLDLAHNPELAEIARRGVPRYSFAEYLGLHTPGPRQRRHRRQLRQIHPDRPARGADARGRPRSRLFHRRRAAGPADHRPLGRRARPS